MALTILEANDEVVGKVYIGFVPHQKIEDIEARLRRYKKDRFGDSVGYRRGVYFWDEGRQLACNWASAPERALLVVTGTDRETVRSTAERVSKALDLTEIYIPEAELRRHIYRTEPQRN